eukprot:TRINITY_DN30671_c0_g1_i1.p2 TRINITY_DN30671_c0_g1~~TRINITY_DN30671_c0_g1_i1.p2  ORF type:complete len:235 (+),score=37.01 TRINITY_DN30671_c0_g1_i1:38-706(+)
MGQQLAAEIGRGEVLYGYHGTPKKNAPKIVGWNILPADLKESAVGMMGGGVYVTTDLGKAQSFGPYILVVEFVPIPITALKTYGLKLSNQVDNRGSWRAQGFNGVYVPPGYITHRDEFCIRQECIRKIRKYGHSRAQNERNDQLVARTREKMQQYWPEQAPGLFDSAVVGNRFCGGVATRLCPARPRDTDADDDDDARKTAARTARRATKRTSASAAPTRET